MGSAWSSKKKLKKVDTVQGFPVSLAFLKRALYALPKQFLDATPHAQNFDIQWRVSLTGWQGEVSQHWAWYFASDTPLLKLLSLDKVEQLDKVVLTHAQHVILCNLNIPCAHDEAHNVDVYTWSAP